MLAMEDMANVNTAKLRVRPKVCAQQEVWKHCAVYWLLESILLLQVNTITPVVYCAAAEHNHQRVSLHTRTSDWVLGKSGIGNSQQILYSHVTFHSNRTILTKCHIGLGRVECESESTVVRVYVTVTYKVSGGTPPLILNLSIRWLDDHDHASAALALGQCPVTR